MKTITRRNFFKRMAGLAIFAPLIPAVLAKVSAITPVSTFGPIPPLSKRLLGIGKFSLVTERFAQAGLLPVGGRTIKFRRYEAFPSITKPASEGIRIPSDERRLPYKDIEIPRSLIEGEGG